ncbi:phosphomethylpyrimidine synthase ThiC [candidate division WOR-3 bacterium]|nr:phosphomethylpyrimidine synthase ThiC [candidate division WOR-3 bacterium]
MTQIDKARTGESSPELLKACANEGLDAEHLRKNLAQGFSVLPKNRLHSLDFPKLIGKDCPVKVNVNIGTSKGYSSQTEEMAKAKISFEYGTDAIMILSTWGDLRGMRKELVELSPVPVGSVPIYDAAVKAFTENRKVIDFSEKDFLEMVLMHAEDGIDFMTIHVGITKDVLKKVKNSERILKVVSRGGAIVSGWMISNGLENPFYRNFDEILSIAKDYDVTLSLGDGMRPGAVADGTDPQQIEELFVLGELVEKARKAGVQVMVEGPGHLYLDQIEMNVKLAKRLTYDAPFFVLGPLVTDCAPGYDHIVGAIGGALAAYHGADFLCYVTPAEHVSLPDAEDVKEGLIVSKIAAQSANSARNFNTSVEKEILMAKARKAFDWEKEYALSVDKGEKARSLRERRPYDGEGCSMCGPFCALKILEDSFGKEDKDTAEQD